MARTAGGGCGDVVVLSLVVVACLSTLQLRLADAASVTVYISKLAVPEGVNQICAVCGTKPTATAATDPDPLDDTAATTTTPTPACPTTSRLLSENNQPDALVIASTGARLPSIINSNSYECFAPAFAFATFRNPKDPLSATFTPKQLPAAYAQQGFRVSLWTAQPGDSIDVVASNEDDDGFDLGDLLVDLDLDLDADIPAGTPEKPATKTYSNLKGITLATDSVGVIQAYVATMADKVPVNQWNAAILHFNNPFPTVVPRPAPAAKPSSSSPGPSSNSDSSTDAQNAAVTVYYNVTYLVYRVAQTGTIDIYSYEAANAMVKAKARRLLAFLSLQKASMAGHKTSLRA